MKTVIPSFVKARTGKVVDNCIVVDCVVVDPDAHFIHALTTEKTNDFIKKFSNIYVVGTTAHCNMSCRNCYYKVDNKAEDRTAGSIVRECVISGMPTIWLMGAEPTTREDLPDIIRALVAKGKTVGMTTNGKKLEDPTYVGELKAAGLGHVNYTVHFEGEFRAGKLRRTVIDNLRAHGIPICQLAFTIVSMEDLHQAVHAIDYLIDLGVSPMQFAVRAGAAIGNCHEDSGLFMSDMVKAYLALGAALVPDAGSNLYFVAMQYRGHALHVVRWPTNETALAISNTGPVFATNLGPMRSPFAQITMSMSDEQIAEEKRTLLPHSVEVAHVDESFGRLRALEWNTLPGIWLHCDITKWGPQEARRCKEIWPKFLAGLSKKGYKVAYSAVPEDDTKTLKWNRLFGMCETSRKPGSSYLSRS